MRKVLILSAVLGLPACVPAQPPLADRVASGVRPYGILVMPEDLTLAEAAAMSLTLDRAGRLGYLDTRRRLRAILGNPGSAD